MSNIVVTGSVAFDHIMDFPGRFKEHILPDKVHMLSVSFLVDNLKKVRGGCAANIAYNLALLGERPKMVATVGDDFAEYRAWLEERGVDTSGTRVIEGDFTASCFITTDLDDNQITAFHPGAMNFSHLNSVYQAREARLGIVAPDGREGMLRHAREFKEADIPFIFDPGQGLPMFSGEELLAFVDQATYVTVNDYEAQMLQERTGYSIDALAGRVQALIVTRGAQGSSIFAERQHIEIACVKPEALVDPTGCGDAYRAGLLYGLARGMDWHTTGQLASLVGALKIASRGGQNHRFTRDSVAERYREVFGACIW